MTTATAPDLSNRPVPPLGGFSLTMLGLEVRRLLRNRRTVIFTMVIPPVLFLLFGLNRAYSSEPAGHGNVAAFILVSMALYGAVLATTSGGAMISIERAQGWSRQLRLTPLTGPSYIATKMATSMVLGFVSVLISGAGIAGSTLAYWLARHGFRPTVVERATGLRSSGNPVDVKGPAMNVAKQMGLMPRLRAAESHVTNMRFVDAAGRCVGRINLRAFQMSAGDREPEVPRAHLASILLEASRDDAEFLWDDTIVKLSQDEGGVNVAFERAEPRRFDLVIGADGLHSAVRRLTFGPETDFVRHVGIYVATLPIDGPVDNDRDVLLYNSPGRMVSVHPLRGHAIAAFMFRSPALPGFDHRDTAQHKRLVNTIFAEDSWRVPDLLERVRAAEDIYFDSASQVRLPQWSSGRIGVLGDAASCLSLFGDGSTLAIAGAFTLAEELAATRTDPETALRRYESRHRTLVDPKLRGFRSAAALLIPATRRGIAVRNLATHLFPIMTAAGSLRRRITSRHP